LALSITSQKLQHLQNFLFGFSSVFDTHNLINLLHPHLGAVLPFEFPIDDALLPAMTNPKKRKIANLSMRRTESKKRNWRTYSRGLRASDLKSKKEMENEKEMKEKEEDDKGREILIIFCYFYVFCKIMKMILII
jgi:hypothetical protein